MQIEEILKRQHTAFESGKTKNLIYRLNALDKLYKSIVVMEDEINDALQKDLGKSRFEGFMSEIGMTLSEITYMKQNLRKLTKRKKVSTPLTQFHAKSYLMPEPYGTVLIMSPWNYPFVLTLEPLVDAIAAGNTAVVKPSAYSPATSAVIKKLLEFSFEQDVVAVIEGGRDINASLLEQKYDYIFFTGGKAVGRLVMEKAAAHLTPITLELGGKSPCIIDSDCDIKVAAKRVAFGKFLNCGQTCVAPDYLFVQESIKTEFMQALKKAVTKMYGAKPLENPDYGKIVNHKHYERLLQLLEGQDVYHGGETDGASRIAPTILDNTNPDSPIMQEEIFGPLLPVMTFQDMNEVVHYVNQHEKPLAAYYFTKSKEKADFFLSNVSFGGGCINDTIIHLASSELPFGGVGESGMGSYHGKYGFDTFTHYKSIVHKSFWIDLPMRYQKYTALHEKMLRMFLK